MEGSVIEVRSIMSQPLTNYIISSTCNNCLNMFKCLLNVLQHTQPLLFKLIEPRYHDCDDKHDVIMMSSELGGILLKDIQWPEGGDRQWLINLLMDLQSHTERILKEGQF